MPRFKLEHECIDNKTVYNVFDYKEKRYKEFV